MAVRDVTPSPRHILPAPHPVIAAIGPKTYFNVVRRIIGQTG